MPPPKKKTKTDFKKNVSKLMSNVIFGKITKNVRNHMDIKLVTVKTTGNYLVLEPNYHTTNFDLQNLLAIKLTKAQVNISKLVYLGLSILEISKITLYEH